MINIAVVGAGYWGKNLVRNFYNVRDCRLKYVVDMNPDIRARNEKAYPGVQGVADIDTALADPEIDGIVIATPVPTHYALAHKALEARKHVYVEKPLTLRGEEAAALVKTAARVERQLMVGHLMLYHSALTWVKDYIAAGELGDILYMYAQRVNLGIVRSHESALWSLAPHDISMILYLLDAQPTVVQARGQSYLQPGIEDVVFLGMHFADKKIAQVHVSWLDPHKERKLTIVGTRKMIVFDDMQATEKIRIFDRSIHASPENPDSAAYLSVRYGDIYLPHLELKEPLALECAHFIECIRENKPARSDGHDGLRVVRTLEAAQQSLDNGGVPVRLDGAETEPVQ